jgi:hypothetical protein
MFSKKREVKIFKIKRLFSFIIACYFKSLNTIQSFREIKRRNRLILRDFHHIFQDVIAACQKDIEFDFNYRVRIERHLFEYMNTSFEYRNILLQHVM